MADITPTNTGKLRTITIKPGEKFILPPGADVRSVVIDGAIDVNSSCNNLPPISQYACGFFYLILDVDDNDAHSMDEKYTVYMSVKVGDTSFDINQKVIGDGDNPGSATNSTTLNTFITDKALFQFTNVRRTILSKRQAIWVYFKSPQQMMSSIELSVSNNGSLQYYKPNTAVCNEYPLGDDAVG